MEELENMKHSLITIAYAQMDDLSKVCAKELGEVIDMIKDIEEAKYYHTIVNAMNESVEN